MLHDKKKHLQMVPPTISKPHSDAGRSPSCQGVLLVLWLLFQVRSGKGWMEKRPRKAGGDEHKMKRLQEKEKGGNVGKNTEYRMKITCLSFQTT